MNNKIMQIELISQYFLCISWVVLCFFVWGKGACSGKFLFGWLFYLTFDAIPTAACSRHGDVGSNQCFF